MKKCRKCGIDKDADQFRGDTRYMGGLASWCKQCHRDRNSTWARENRERLSAKAAEWRAANPEKARQASRKHSAENRAKRLAANRQWALNNPEKRRAIDAARRAVKLKSMPPWAEIDEIAKFYMNAPDGYQVDHIVPLKSEMVCGLHCLANLQYLTPAENQSKKNYWWPGNYFEDAQRQGRLFA